MESSLQISKIVLDYLLRCIWKSMGNDDHIQTHRHHIIGSDMFCVIGRRRRICNVVLVRENDTICFIWRTFECLFREVWRLDWRMRQVSMKGSEVHRIRSWISWRWYFRVMCWLNIRDKLRIWWRKDMQKRRKGLVYKQKILQLGPIERMVLLV